MFVLIDFKFGYQYHISRHKFRTIVDDGQMHICIYVNIAKSQQGQENLYF